jgi:hypothetical protein
MKLRCFLVAMATITLLAAACDDDPVRTSRSPSNTTPKDNAEAELAALWLSGDLIAPQELYETIRDDLDAIRTEFADSTTMASIEFMAPWLPSQLLVRFTAEGKQKVQTGNYPELEALNLRFGLSEFDTSSSLWPNYGSARLTFSGRKHPLVMRESYDDLADVMWAEPNGFIGDWSCVYPWEIDGGVSYLFRHAWGDCPAGCINSVFWYFRVVGGEIEYVGRYDVRGDPEPDWWVDGKTALNAYRGYER